MCIVSDSTVAPLYADQVKAELLKVTDHVYQFTFPAGEAYKNLDTVQDLFQCLIENGLDRKSLVVALGGGVTGDLSGFGAAPIFVELILSRFLPRFWRRWTAA